MNRTLVLIFTPLIAAVLIAGLVYFALRFAGVFESATSTVVGFTARRLCATLSALIAVASVVAGRMAVARPSGRFGTTRARLGILAGGVLAVASGGVVLAIAEGGPGSGNGVVGAAVALVLGLIAVVLGVIAEVQDSNRASRAYNSSPSQKS